MNKVNYQKALEAILCTLPGTGNRVHEKRKRLLLHSCCAPCSSYVLTYLREYFDITLLYYNPNITQREEYDKRVEEQRRLVGLLNEEKDSSQGAFCLIKMEEGAYEPQRFFELAKGLEQVPEGGERCFRCYELRLRETARMAAERRFDYFTTTLTISPLKNADKLNETGARLGQEYGVAFLPSDFKKKNGYRQSVELSAKYGLYRQNYCGCVFSRRS